MKRKLRKEINTIMGNYVEAGTWVDTRPAVEPMLAHFKKWALEKSEKAMLNTLKEVKKYAMETSLEDAIKIYDHWFFQLVDEELFN